MEKLEEEQERGDARDPSAHKKLRRCQILNANFIMILVVLVLAICIAIPLISKHDEDDQVAAQDRNPTDLYRAIQPCNISLFDQAEVQDVVIVGGGPAGTFVGYRLVTVHSDWKVLLLEATSRIGGRLYSVSLPGIDFNVAELGGMRYLPRHIQPYINKVVEEMGIDTKQFLMDEGNVNRPYRFRDVFVQQKNLEKAGKEAYKLKKDEQDKTPSEISQMIFEATVPKHERTKPPYQVQTVHGYPLINYGSINVYSLVNASDDAHNYVIDATGYSDLYSNENAAGSIGDTKDTERSQGYRTPVDGMESVPRHLARNFTHHGGRIKMNTAVTQIDECIFPNSTSLYILTTYNYESLESQVYFARRVVLAVTRTQLKRIHWDALWTSPKRKLIDSVISREAAKTFLAFDEPWWRKESLQYLNLTQGRTISSLPSRQTYYFTAPKPQVSNRSFVMIYNDGQFSKFWSALASPDFEGFRTSNSAIFPMTETLVREAVRELAINHNTTEEVIGWPYFGWIMVWDPNLLPRNVPGYGPYMPSEAWTLWAPGFNYADATTSVIKLDPTQQIFICGSVYSTQQGWTEGAFLHADQMLTEHFNMSSYLSQDEQGMLRKSFYAYRRVPFYP